MRGHLVHKNLLGGIALNQVPVGMISNDTRTLPGLE